MSWSCKSDYTVAYQVALEVICGQSVGIGSRSSLKDSSLFGPRRHFCLRCGNTRETKTVGTTPPRRFCSVTLE